jgi:hypothetical protein
MTPGGILEETVEAASLAKARIRLGRIKMGKTGPDYPIHIFIRTILSRLPGSYAAEEMTANVES